jgi:hypothetical protein
LYFNHLLYLLDIHSNTWLAIQGYFDTGSRLHSKQGNMPLAVTFQRGNVPQGFTQCRVHNVLMIAAYFLKANQTKYAYLAYSPHSDYRQLRAGTAH